MELYRWKAKCLTHGNRGGLAGLITIPQGTKVLTDVYSPMAERITFWVESTGDELWLPGDEFTRTFERA